MHEDAYGRAGRHVLPVGKYASQTLARVGDHAEGLLYLQWLAGRSWVEGPTREALAAYLADPEVARRLAEALERRGGSGYAWRRRRGIGEGRRRTKPGEGS